MPGEVAPPPAPKPVSTVSRRGKSGQKTDHAAVSDAKTKARSDGSPKTKSQPHAAAAKNQPLAAATTSRPSAAGASRTKITADASPAPKTKTKTSPKTKTTTTTKTKTKVKAKAKDKTKAKPKSTDKASPSAKASTPAKASPASAAAQTGNHTIKDNAKHTTSNKAYKAPEAEPGNRRRRRRSRDRDRDRDEAWSGDSVDLEGRLDLRDEGYGFLRVNGCLPSRNDAYVPVKTIRQYGLRRGDHLTGTSRPANRSEKNPALLSLLSINDGPAELSDRPRFEHLTAVHAARQLTLERPGDLTSRLIDMVAPIGLGQRVLIWAPRRSGAAALLASLVAAIETNEPSVYVMGLFLDQRPEEITSIRSNVKNGEVAATSFDQPAEDHVQTAEMTVERARRLAELGSDVAVVCDSLTALARAYNITLSNSGKAYSGKVESGAVHMPKKLFGAGRNLGEAGSITMVATISSDEPRYRSYRSVDGVVCDEFDGTASTDIHLDRWAAERGLLPAVDLSASLSRDEHHFLGENELRALRDLRRGFIAKAGEGPSAAVSALDAALQRLRSTASNAELLR